MIITKHFILLAARFKTKVWDLDRATIERRHCAPEVGSNAVGSSFRRSVHEAPGLDDLYIMAPPLIQQCLTFLGRDF